MKASQNEGLANFPAYGGRLLTYEQQVQITEMCPVRNKSPQF